ncbi:MAG: nitroreductase [Nocardioides sp.]|nr:nitroreductase [Nocardioides sp.]
MTFTHPRGTRGGKLPAGRFFRIGNAVVRRLLRLTGGRLAGLDVLVLTTTGRRSGEPRTTPVMCFADGPGRYLVVASANGAQRNPGWYHNLAAAPDDATAQVHGEMFPVRAEELGGAERDAAWTRITGESSRFTSYAEKTDRDIPVLRLTRTT